MTRAVRRCRRSVAVRLAATQGYAARRGLVPRVHRASPMIRVGLRGLRDLQRRDRLRRCPRDAAGDSAARSLGVRSRVVLAVEARRCPSTRRRPGNVERLPSEVDRGCPSDRATRSPAPRAGAGVPNCLASVRRVPSERAARTPRAALPRAPSRSSATRAMPTAQAANRRRVSRSRSDSRRAAKGGHCHVRAAPASSLPDLLSRLRGRGRTAGPLFIGPTNSIRRE